MPSAPLPSNERERLVALRGYELLDTPPEPAFDALTALAANVFNVPMALVSLIDEHRQWFKSKCGLSGVDSTGRDVAFCSYAILQNDVFEVSDAAADPRFADNPLVTGPPYIRFYAGAPVRDAAGMALGTICIIDHVPRALSDAQRDQLRMLAEAVAGVIALRIRPSELAFAWAYDGAEQLGMLERREAIDSFATSIAIVDQLAHSAHDGRG